MSEIDEERIRKLIVLLRTNRNRNKQAALRELSKHKDNPLVVEAIVYTLGYPGNSGTRELAESIIMELGERVSSLIMDLLHHKDWVFRKNIISSLSFQEICGNKAVDTLVRMLKHDKSDDVRSEAAIALGRIGDKRTLDSLITALDNPSDAVRIGAVKALGELGDSRAVPKLTAHLMDEHPFVRSRVIDALVKIGDPSSLNPLRSVLLNILNQLVASPEILAKYQEKKRLKQEQTRQRIMRDRKRIHYRELDSRIRKSVGVD